MEEAVRQTLQQLKGAHGIVVMSSRRTGQNRRGPDWQCRGGGDWSGRRTKCSWLLISRPSWNIPARWYFWNRGRWRWSRRTGCSVQTLDGKPVHYQVHNVAWDPIAAEKGEYRHFMQKEIHEQVRSLTDTLAGRVDFDEGKIRLPQLNLTPEIARANQKNRDHRLRNSRPCRDGWKDPDRTDRPHSGGGGYRL